MRVLLDTHALPEPYAHFMERELATNDFGILPIALGHSALLTDLPFHHRDPFDRLLIAQSMAEGIPLISCDEHFDA